MRSKEEILNSTYRNAKKAHESQDVALIHSLHTLEVLIDIRDILVTDAKDALNTLIEIRNSL
ncbi:hypothetical protein ES702_06756 [subsurface metagenome]